MVGKHNDLNYNYIYSCIRNLYAFQHLFYMVDENAEFFVTKNAILKFRSVYNVTYFLYSGQQIRNAWKVLKCGAGEGRKR